MAQSLEAQVKGAALAWQSSASAKDWQGAWAALVPALKRCKDTLSSSASDDAKNAALICGIFIRGLQNTTELLELSSEEGWSRDHEKIEAAWRALCDAQDRLIYAGSFIDFQELHWPVGQLNHMDEEFMRVLGPGLYMSPEILVKRESCSVCGLDMRQCDHIPGQLYAGVRCAGIPEDIELRTVSMVKDPRDRRCRIWPWRFKDANTFEATVMTLFRLDDFVEDSE